MNLNKTHFLYADNLVISTQHNMFEEVKKTLILEGNVQVLHRKPIETTQIKRKRVPSTKKIKTQTKNYKYIGNE